MATISGTAVIAGVPTNGVSVKAYKASRFGSIPAYDAAAPGAADAGPVTSGVGFGGSGEWQIVTPTLEDYYVAATYAGHTAWQLIPAGPTGPVGPAGPGGVGGPAELGYAEITTTQNTTNTAATDVAGMTTTITVGTRPIVIEVGGYFECQLGTVDTHSAFLEIYDQTGSAILYTLVHLMLSTGSGSGDDGNSAFIRRRIAAGTWTAASSRTIKLRQYVSATPARAACIGGATFPFWLSVREL